MYLFIFESIGTSELLLIGVVAVMFLGPRRLPEMARKIGKIMSEFRGTANEFKQTWQREVDFEEEAKIFDLNAIEKEVAAKPATATTAPAPTISDSPTIKAVDPARFEELKARATNGAAAEPAPILPSDTNDKQNWL